MKEASRSLREEGINTFNYDLLKQMPALYGLGLVASAEN
jgi:hypothetical protein